MNILKSLLLFGLKRRYKGFGFLTKMIYRNGFVTPNKYGVVLSLDPYEAVEGSVLFDGYFDEPVLLALLDHLRDGDTFWDIGANVGLHSLTIKKQLPNVECHCFEPFYSNFYKFVLNQHLNRTLPVQKYNFGLSESVSMETLYTTKNNHGRSGFYKMSNSFSTDINVLTITGDSLVGNGIAIPNVIKIDTEGHELSVLKGCKMILASQQLRAVVFETFSNKDEIITFLKAYGFAISPIDQEDNYMAIRS